MELTNLQILYIIITGGALGGLVAFLNNVYPSKCPKLKLKCSEDILLLSVNNMIIGIGGAIAVVGTLAFWSKEDIGNSPLTVLGVSVIFGFAARAMLPKIAKKLESKLIDKIHKNEADLKKVKKFIKKQKEDIINMQNEFNDKIRFERNIDLANTVLSPNTSTLPNDTNIALSGLKWNLHQEPTDRLTTILLGRLYSEQKRDDKKALEVSEEFINLHKSDSELDPVVLSAIYYNAACYASVIAYEPNKDEKIKQNYIQKCLTYLNFSLELDSKNIDDVKADIEEGGDFTDLYKEGYLSDIL